MGVNRCIKRLRLQQRHTDGQNCYYLQPSSNPYLRAIMFSSHRILLLVLVAVALYPSFTSSAAVIPAAVSARGQACGTFA
uniref:Uncharacterized protein n=1 Tax=Plectus sambesii TaxID=2011161 RepID=A0A914X8Y8_9BILA